MIIPSFINKDLSQEILNIVDGLVVTGGCGDSDADDRIEIKEKPRALLEQNERRYVADKYLIEGALERDMPLIGICRGMQMICEVAGGEINYEFLHEVDTGGVSHQQESAGNIPTHAVRLKEGSQLQEILGVSEIDVNSFHNQYCAKPGKNFEACAWANNGIVEAIESPIYRFSLGLQFHPEMMFVDHPVFAKIFGTLVDNCREYKKFR